MKVSWAPATPPYTVEVVSANDPCGDPLFVNMLIIKLEKFN